MIGSLIVRPPPEKPNIAIPKLSLKPLNTKAITTKVSISEQKKSDFSEMSHRELVDHFASIPSKILDYLFLGSRIPAHDKVVLHQHKITHILNCAGAAFENKFSGDFAYKTLFVGDCAGEDISCFFYEVIDFIEEARIHNGRILVHCHQGVSRSSAFVISYLMWKNGWDFRRAEEFTREARPSINPNEGFVGQLMLWGKLLKSPLREGCRMYRIAPVPPNLLAPKAVATVGFSSLDPRGCFIIQAPQCIYIWIGANSADNQMNTATSFLGNLQKYENGASSSVQFIQQGNEPSKFWQCIGGQGDVAKVAVYDSEYGKGR